MQFSSNTDVFVLEWVETKFRLYYRNNKEENTIKDLHAAIAVLVFRQQQQKDNVPTRQGFRRFHAQSRP